MKKLILLLTFAFVMCGCVQSVGDTRTGKRMSVPIEKGATRLTITKDYIIVETCDGFNGFNQPFWRCDKIMNNDSIHQEELISRLKEE
jgi:hypothetical protein